MRIPFAQLAANLASSGVAPVVMICGDEPFQMGEAATLVRQVARERGYTEREVLEVEGQFDWDRLAAAALSRSLFAGQKLIELRLASGKIGRDGGEAVRAYCARPRPEHRLLILAPNLDYQELKAKWVQTVEQTGILLQVQALTGQRLVEWIAQRLRAQGLVPGPEVAAMLAERVEGNLLAAAQEVDKLALLQGPGPLTAEQLGRAIADSARFDLFAIPDAALAGDRARMYRIIQGLAAEGTAEPLVLWVLAREVRLLARATFAAREGTRALDAFLTAERIWQNRQGPLRALLRRLPATFPPLLLGHCALADRQIKGLAPGDPWLTLTAIGDALAGGPPPQSSSSSPSPSS
ncbi:MAG TPA: DNA polymerase III subunit delta [Chromatiaceae bacterium]|nr:DNA polymerase III subunit delta [Chromatiaceae bacterium]